MRLSQPTLPVDETRLNSFLSRMQDLNRLLEIHFAAITVERGRRYQQRAHVLSWHWESDPPTLSGAVRGTGDVPYNVRVQFDWTHNIDLAHIHDSDVESYCNCPVGRQCKHAVALILEAMPRLLLLASKQQRPNGAPTGQAAKLIELFGNAAQPADPDAKAVGQAEAWLSTLRPSERASTPARQPSSMRLLYNVAARTLPTAAFLPDQETAQPRTPRQPVQTLQARAWLRHNDDRWQSGPVHLFRRHLVPKAVMDARDVECLQALAAAARDHKEALKDPDGMSLSRGAAAPLQGLRGAWLLGQLLQTGRAQLDGTPKTTLSPGAARLATLRWQMDETGDLHPHLHATPAVDAVWQLTPPHYFDRERVEVGPLQCAVPHDILCRLLQAPPVAPGAVTQVRDGLKTLGVPVDALPPHTAVRTLSAGPPQPHLRLLRQQITQTAAPTLKVRPRSAPREVYGAELCFRYPLTDAAQSTPAIAAHRTRPVLRWVETAPSTICQVERDADAEHNALQHLALGADWALDAGPETLPLPPCLHFASRDSAFAFGMQVAPELEALGWQIKRDSSWDLDVLNVDDADWHIHLHTAEPGETASSGIDWFSLELGIRVGPHTIDLIPPLLAYLTSLPTGATPADIDVLDDAARITVDAADAQGQRLCLALPAGRLKPLLRVLFELVRGGLQHGAGLRIPSALSAELERLAEAARMAGLRWLEPAMLRRAQSLVQALGQQPPPRLPSTVKATLRPYQRQGLAWLQGLRALGFGGILADDMGLGKTLQTLAHLAVEKRARRLQKPVLIVCPTSVLGNWLAEIKRFTPHFRVLLWHGKERKERQSDFDTCDLVLTSYALLHRDLPLLRQKRFSALILDEAQAIKNAAAATTHAALMIEADHRLCLTGTPVENHLGELWSQFHFLIPGLLGDAKTFRRVFRNPIERDDDRLQRDLLARRVAPFVLRRRKDEVAHDLPEKTEMQERMELEGRQRDLYETVRVLMQEKVRRAIAAKGMAQSHIVMLDALLKLRQICNDPRLLPAALQPKGAPVRGIKLQRLGEMLPPLVQEERHVLVFSQFTRMLTLIEEQLHSLGIPYLKLTGQTRRRDQVVASFQAGAVPVFLISLKAGGTGLNLTRADTVIHFDPWWNPAVEAQATDRAHRIGQARHVFVHKLLTISTVEERILELQQRKAAIAAGVFDPEGRGRASFSEEDFESLFAPLERPVG